MKKYKIKITGLKPGYMQHRMDDTALEEWEKNRKLIIERPDVAKEDVIRAEYHCYRNKEGNCFIPSNHLYSSFIGGGTLVKSKVGHAKKSMKQIVAGMFYIEPEEILIPDYDEIDKRSAVNRNIKGRVITIRPKWSKWEAEFTLNVDNDTITDQTVKQIVENAGQYIGIGSYRPTNNGPYGRFKIEKFERC